MHKRVESWSNPVIQKISGLDRSNKEDTRMMYSGHARALRDAKQTFDQFWSLHRSPKRNKIKTTPSPKALSDLRIRVNTHLGIANAYLRGLTGKKDGIWWTFERLARGK
jgi:hypothetical protein